MLSSSRESELHAFLQKNSLEEFTEVFIAKGADFLQYLWEGKDYEDCNFPLYLQEWRKGFATAVLVMTTGQEIQNVLKKGKYFQERRVGSCLTECLLE